MSINNYHSIKSDDISVGIKFENYHKFLDQYLKDYNLTNESINNLYNLCKTNKYVKITSIEHNNKIEIIAIYEYDDTISITCKENKIIT